MKICHTTVIQIPMTKKMNPSHESRTRIHGPGSTQKPCCRGIIYIIYIVDSPLLFHGHGWCWQAGLSSSLCACLPHHVLRPTPCSTRMTHQSSTCPATPRHAPPCIALRDGGIINGVITPVHAQYHITTLLY